MTRYGITAGRLLTAAVLGASAVIVLAAPALWHETATLFERGVLALWLIGAIASFISLSGLRPGRAPLRWLARPGIGPLLAGLAAVLVLSAHWQWA
ncbi:MAG: hypothetical protein RIB84_05290 [Sneathiellaceae bacterium]